MFAMLKEQLFFIRKSAPIIHGWLSPLVIMTSVEIDIHPTVIVALVMPITSSLLPFAVISEQVDFELTAGSSSKGLLEPM